MTISSEWDELETKLPEGKHGRMVKRIRADSSVDLFIWAQTREPKRGFDLRVPTRDADFELPQGTAGVVMNRVRGDDGFATLSLELADATADALFAIICADIADAVARCEATDEAAALFVNRFVRWVRLLQRVPRGLSRRRQMGLFAELWVLREIYIPAVQADQAVGAWIGPDRAARDFEHAGCAIEVKANATNQPQLVKINGERQLDDTQLDDLHLVHLSLELLPGGSETLPQMVESLRSVVCSLPVETVFGDLLLEAGYSDHHEELYVDVGYALRALSVFKVREGFPRIIESDLADGIGDVKYKLAVDACRQFQVERNSLSTLLVAAHG